MFIVSKILSLYFYQIGIFIPAQVQSYKFEVLDDPTHSYGSPAHFLKAGIAYTFVLVLFSCSI